MAAFESIDLEEVYNFAVKLGKDAGGMLLRAAEARFGDAPRQTHIEKESAVDLVTQTDIGKCNLLIQCVRLMFCHGSLNNI